MDITEVAWEQVAQKARGVKSDDAVEAVESLLNIEMRSSSFDLDRICTAIILTETAKWFEAVIRTAEELMDDHGPVGITLAAERVKEQAQREVFRATETLTSTSTGMSHALHQHMMTQAAARFLQDLEWIVLP